MQTIIPMDNGAGLRLTTARYYTPSGRSIQATGITPDIIVPSAIVSQEEVGKEAEPAKKPKFLREKDLKHHIGNGIDGAEEKGEPAGKEEEQALPPKETASPDAEGQDEELRNDQQLSTALMLLKGMNVLNNRTARSN